MSTFVLCPDCNHAKRRHNQYGCTAATSNGSCLCNRAADEILVDATATKPDVDETATEPAADDMYAADLTEPAPPVATVEPRHPDLIPAEDILARAQAAGGRLATRAEKIRNLITALGKDLTEWERVAQAERLVQELRRQLDEALTQLRELRTGGKPDAAEQTAAPSTRQLRAWALANNVPCPAKGRLPANVLEAWRAAGRPNLDEEAAA